MLVIHRIPDTELNAAPGKEQIFLRTFTQLVTKFPDIVTKTVIGVALYIKCSDDNQYEQKAVRNLFSFNRKIVFVKFASSKTTWFICAVTRVLN
jgi:hypothetical protein